MCIRQGLTQEDLVFRFDVDQSSVSRILNGWIPLLAVHLMGLIKWTSTTIRLVEPPYHHININEIVGLQPISLLMISGACEAL